MKGFAVLLASTLWLLPGLAYSQVLPAQDLEPEPRSSVARDVPETDQVEVPTAQNAWRPVDRAELNKDLDALLSKHQFCADGDYRIPFDEQQLCELAEHARARCPGIDRACANPFLNEREGWSWSLDFLGNPAIALALRLLVWAVIIIVALMLLVALLRRLVTTRDAEQSEGEQTLAPLEEEPAPLTQPVETDVERLLVRARQAAMAGNYRAAVRDLYAALLRRLDRDGLIEVHRSKTNGDYKRSLAPRPELQREFGEIVRTIESVQFGSHEATEQTFHSLLERVTPLVNRSAGVGLLLLCCMNLLACDQLVQRQRASALGCGETPGGYSVLCEMLSAQGASVRRRIREVDEIAEDVDELVVLQGAELSEEEWSTIDRWVRDGHTLVLAQHPSPFDVSLTLERSKKFCSTGSSITESMRAYYGSDTELTMLPERAFLLDDVVGSWAIARCDVGVTLAGVTHGEGTVLLLPSSAFLTNISLAARDNAYLVVDLFAVEVGGVEVIGKWTGSGSANPFEALENARLTPWLFQLLALAGLLALWRGPHFGRPRDMVSSKRHAFVEHVRALGLKYARSKASRNTLANYGSWAIAKLHERLMPGYKASLSDLATVLAKLTGREETAVLQILIAARSAQDEAHDTATREEHLKTMRELESLLKSAGGTR